MKTRRNQAIAGAATGAIILTIGAWALAQPQGQQGAGRGDGHGREAAHHGPALREDHAIEAPFDHRPGRRLWWIRLFAQVGEDTLEERGCRRTDDSLWTIGPGDLLAGTGVEHELVVDAHQELFALAHRDDTWPT